MKAAVSNVYGGPEVIEIKDISKPKPNENEILVKIHATTVNRTDCGFLRAKPFIVRFFAGLLRPKNTVLGCEFAGEVEKVGKDVTLFKAGDKVFGFDDVGWGGHAQYKTIRQDHSVAICPKGKSYEQMAASSEGAHYALSYVRVIQKHGAKKVLVHGATGAIGSAAVQLLKHAGMYVVATSTTKNMDLVKSLGADDVVDHEKENFTKYNMQFDVVFDAVGKSSFRACKPILKKGGLYIATELGYMAQNPVLGIISPLFKLFGAKRVLFPIPRNNKEIIEFLKSRVENNEFTPVIDKTYTLEQIVKAYRYVETGQKTGNVIIKVT